MLPKTEVHAAPAHVLVVEDEVLTRVALADQLRRTGFSVVEATGAEEALSYLQSGGQVDLVFSDVQMPGSLSGLDLARRIRDHYPTLPIILTSGNASMKNMLGLGSFIPKPYDIEDAANLIVQTLGSKP